MTARALFVDQITDILAFVTDNQRRAFAIHFMNPGTKSLRENVYMDVSFERPVLRVRV